MSATMRPNHIIDLLIQEHDTIHSGLYLLDQAASMLNANKPIPEGFQRWIVDFLRNFADKQHHAKEEGILFPALSKKSAGSLDEAIATLLQEHVCFQGCIATLERLNLDLAEDRIEFAAVTHDYVKNLRQHIFRENRELFATARHMLTEGELLELTSMANKTEKADAPSCDWKRYALSLRQWQSKFLAAINK